MIKGAQKQMIVVRTASSRYFEEAYFVLKNSFKPSREHQTDLLTEADRIIRESENARNGKTVKKTARSALWFLAGSGAGAALAALILLLL